MIYTQGEWKAQGSKITAFGRGVIAKCPRPNDDGVFEFIANAYLIATAPEMYEALKGMVKDSKWMRLEYGDLDEATRFAEEALAKAEGREL